MSQAISPLTPTVTGTVTSYSVNPALPAGITLNATTGAISGTPTTATAAATYTVTATNSSGSTTAGVSMTVNDVAPVIAYDNPSYQLVSGVPATITPVNTGGAATGWSISPSLPEGLTFSATDGGISGAPTNATAAVNYTVTAQNSAGTDTFELSISIDSGVLLELGHQAWIAGITYEGNRVLSVDSKGHWVLWNATTAALIAQGEVDCLNESCKDFVALAGNTVAIRTADGLSVRDASDGHVIANATVEASWWKLASDGSYVAAGTATEVSAWSRAGASLFVKAGDYSQGRAFAAPAELRIAAGAAGATTLEKIAVSTGTSTTTAPFSGQFHSWFVDGARFLTNVSNTVWVYDTAGTQVDLRALSTVENLTGQGDWFWTASVALNIYEVGASASPAATYALGTLDAAVASGETLAILRYGNPDMSVVDLTGATPVKVDYTTPRPYLRAFAARSSTQWLTGTDGGVVVDSITTPGTPKYFGWGDAYSIATSTERIAVATASGRIVYFDAASREQEGVIDFASSKVVLSGDGSTLVALANSENSQYETDRSLRVYSLPSGNLVRTEPYSYSSPPYPIDVSLSSNGQTLGKVMLTGTGPATARVVESINGGAPIWSDTVAQGGVPVHLSPNGTLFAVSDQASLSNAATNIYLNGTLNGAALGWALGWLDDNRLLLNRYQDRFGLFVIYQGTATVTPTGVQTDIVTLAADIRRFQPVSADSIYSPEQNTIISITDGQVIWHSSNPTQQQGGVTATHVIFSSGSTVRAEPF